MNEASTPIDNGSSGAPSRASGSSFYTAMRILPRPLHTYSDRNRSVIEGALFAFVLGTDPELLMQIEARSGADGTKWQVGFARAASAELSVRVDEQEVWSAADASVEYKTRRDVGYCIVREAEE